MRHRLFSRSVDAQHAEFAVIRSFEETVLVQLDVERDRTRILDGAKLQADRNRQKILPTENQGTTILPSTPNRSRKAQTMREAVRGRP